MPLAKPRNFAIPVCVALVFSFAQCARGQFTNIINVPPDRAPSSTGADTQLNLFDGGELPSSFTVGATNALNSNVELNVLGGVVGDVLTINNNSVVNVSDGSVGVATQVGQRATLNVSGGSVGYFISLGRGGMLNVSGGIVAGNIFPSSQSNIVISGGEMGAFRASGIRVIQTGGSLGRRHRAESGSTYELSGGTFEPEMYVGGRANLIVRGGEFRLDGELLPELSDIGSQVTYGDGTSGEFNRVFTQGITGILADGTPFSFRGMARVGKVTLETDLIVTSKSAEAALRGRCNSAVPGHTIYPEARLVSYVYWGVLS